MKGRILAAAGLAMLMLAPSALAVHGEAYDAYGTATRVVGTNVENYLVHVHWGGYFSPTFAVEIMDMSGNPLLTDSFPGLWQAAGPNLLLFEILAYHGWASPTAGGSVHFDILGVQGQQVLNGAPNKAVMLYVGNYYEYRLALVVPFGIDPF
jgi:hypothetical protein